MRIMPVAGIIDVEGVETPGDTKNFSDDIDE